MSSVSLYKTAVISRLHSKPQGRATPFDLVDIAAESGCWKLLETAAGNCCWKLLLLLEIAASLQRPLLIANVVPGT